MRKTSNDAYNIIEKSDFSHFAKFFDDSDFDIKASKWQYIEDNYHAISLYLRPITLSLELEHYLPNHPIIELLAILKNHYLSGKNPGKLKLSDDIGLNLPSAIIPYLKADPKDKYLNPYRFEFYVYTKVYHHLDRGRMFCNESLTYRDIDQDLITTKMIKQATLVCQNHGYDKVLSYADKYLEDKLKELDDTWAMVNNNISSGNNTGIEIFDTSNGINWQITYDASEKIDDSFFKKLPKVDIATIFHFINDQFDLYSVFEHIKGKYVKQTKPTALAITACILSEAFGFGINKMAEISDMNANTLYATRENFIRLETLRLANDHIANHIEKLPIFKAWNLLDEKLLADMDGQKASTKANTIKSRYSRKYLGKGKGLSVLSLIANFMAIAVKNIGLNEYEGHHLFDMIYDNQSNVKVDALTGDNHTLNQLNTIVLDAINVDFVPSVKNIKSETVNLYYGFINNEGNRLFKPVGQIKLERIHKYSNEITRVLLSLIMQDNTQAIIIRKLNSHSRYAGLRSALVEYNKIFNSIHVLNLINNSQLRKAIRTARNRTESYHQLQKLIRRLYYGVFKGKRIVDQDISTQAVRLTSNIIVAYNSIILNQLYESLVSKSASKKEIENFLRISPMAWIHIALTGKYTFNGKDHKIDLKKIIELLESELKDFTRAND